MNFWVTGANGFIGRHLVRHLTDEGHVVHGLGHGAIEEIERERLGLAKWVNGEIETANLSALAAQAGFPQAIFHLAGGSSVGLSLEQPHEDFSRTVCSTARVLEWAFRFAPSCRLVVASSAAVYGADHSGPISEEAEAMPMSPYGTHKLMMEQLCRSYSTSFGLQSTVVRLFSVYGSHLRKQLLWDLCSRLQKGERTLTLGGTGAEVRDWVHVRDVVRLFAVIANSPQEVHFRTINGGSSIGARVTEIATILADAWGEDIKIKFSGRSRPGDPFSLLASTERLSRLPFAWQIPVEVGVTEYVNWFKGQSRR